MKYINKTRVPFSETGVKKGISVIGAAHMIEDNVCAFFAAFGRDSASVRAKYNVVWMFVKNKFRFGADVVWNEEISEESFFTQIAAASVTVDTVIKNSKGETVVYARTETCAIDLDTYRIRRISSVDGFMVWPPCTTWSAPSSRNRSHKPSPAATATKP